jgi:hypothetical protein
MPDQEFNRNGNPPRLDELITFGEASILSGFTDRHLRKLAVNHNIWAVKLGRNWFTTHQAISDYLAKKRKPGPKPQKGQ